MKILFVADIVGSAGRDAAAGIIPGLKKKFSAFVIANGENTAGGLGITPGIAKELFSVGVDVITTGNHVFRRKEIIPFLDEERRILRPANYAARTPGRGWSVYSAPGGASVVVVNLLGQVFIDWASDPVECIDAILDQKPEEAGITIVDFHAEATGEKAGLFRYLDGRVTAVIGTHTHVQTADEAVSPAGTAFISDAGMTGPVDSVIGLDPERVIKRLTTNIPQTFKPAGGNARLEGVMIEVDAATGKCLSIERIRVPWARS